MFYDKIVHVGVLPFKEEPHLSVSDTLMLDSIVEFVSFIEYQCAVVAEA